MKPTNVCILSSKDTYEFNFIWLKESIFNY